MKLLNQSIKYLSVSIFLIVTIWSAIFYINMLDEIHDSIDDGLDNYKLLIIKRTEKDERVFEKRDFEEGNFTIHKIDEKEALGMRDYFTDTLLYMQNEDDLEPVRMLTSAFKHGEDYYRLTVFNSTVEEDDLIEDLFYSIIWLYIILVASIVLINNVVLQRLWKPFYLLLSDLKAFRIDRESPLPVVKGDTKEFKELELAVNSLIIHARETYANQKKFTENASHELQTPLAIISNKLELMLEKESLGSENSENVGQILHTIQRLTRLNKSLLLLSKIENRQFNELAKVDFAMLVNQSVEDLEDFAGFRNVEVTVEETGKLYFLMDESLASILVSNLLRNAIFHNLEGGKVRVKLNENSLQVSNTGKRKELDSKKIFDRFQKETNNNSSTGLGLAIVHAICRLYGFEVNYTFDGQHCFEVKMD
ncbi:HAMP domain-containing sensor histidine kinase [Algoriphagus sp. NG3]|uniref:sensor histidine kinase n=1 Tax=Algoriphagus sp. NG3 TaxID=3097546 RepID=UPI002A7FF82E|nr:HAMP domain-containing sensor histidine kinase [Algoriphagus sp. NG3]WPR75019.1 HAMP domain-containing sensor histidine kinase [Algoriphagus sp. NG3]